MSEKAKDILIWVLLILLVASIPTLLIRNHRNYIKWQEEWMTISEDSYANKKTVEDTCRAYIASYEADCITYMSLRDSASEIDLETANAAKLRANRTAATYNEYYLKNNYIWREHVPDDIAERLDYLE